MRSSKNWLCNQAGVFPHGCPAAQRPQCCSPLPSPCDVVSFNRDRRLRVGRHDVGSKVVRRSLGLDAAQVHMPARHGRCRFLSDQWSAQGGLSFFRIGIEFDPDSGRRQPA